MADQQKIDNQDSFNSFLERELELRMENQAFLGETLSIGAQIADQIQNQLGKVAQKLTLDKEILKSSKDNVNVLKRLNSSYSSINDVQKDQLKIQKQIQTNQNVIVAKSKDLTKQELAAARAYVDKEKALEKQQSITAELLQQQEEMEAQFRAQEDAGKALSQEQVNRRVVMEGSIKASQASTAEMTKQQIAAEKIVNPQAVSVELLKDQNAELDKANAYLEEQESRLREIEKAQGLFNVSLGFAEGFLKKIGAQNAVISLGLEEGKAAAEQMAKELSEGGTKSVGLFGQMKILFAGISGTIGGMAKGLKEAITLVGALTLVSKTLGKALGALVSPIMDFGKEIKGQISAGFDFLKKKFFSLSSYIESFQVGEQFFFQISQNVADTATNLGVGTKEAQNLFNQAKKVNREVGMLPEELMKVTAGLNESFGTTQKFSTDTVKTVGQLVNLLGLSNQEAAEFTKLAELSGETTADTVLQYKSEIQALKARNNIAISEKEIMKEIAGTSAATQLTLRGQGKSLADAAFQAKKMGLEMGKVEGISSSLLNFEDSIAKEMEAELLIGRDLQLDKARQLALQGDLAGVAEEVASQIGSAAEFGKMSVMQQEALAASVGMTRDELAKTLKTQELLANTGFDDMSSAQQQFNKLLKETGSEEKAIAALKKKGASQALTDQLRQVSPQEQEVQRQRDLVDAQYEMAQAMLPVAKAFRQIQQRIEDIRKVIVGAMQPFFKSFGGMVGEGGKAFETMVLPYAKKLGEFLNDVGLRITDIVSNNGPMLKEIFSGVLNVVSGIYNVIRGVVKSLLGMKSEGDSSKGTFESIRDVVNQVAEKLANVDIEALTLKIKDFIDNVKNIFEFIFDKVGKIGGFLGDNPGLTKAMGAGALILKSPVGGAVAEGAKGVVSKGAGMLLDKAGLGGLGKVLGLGGGKKPTGTANDPLAVDIVGGGGGIADAMGDALGRRNTGLLKGLKGLSKVAGGKKTVVGRALRGAAAMAGKRTSMGGQVLKGAKGLLSGGKGLATGAKLLKGAAGGIGSLIGGLALDFVANKKKNEADEKRALAAQSSSEEERKQLLKEAAKAENTGKLASVGSSAASGAGFGAMVGSVVPGLGTAIGGAVGGVIGAGVGIAKEYGEDIKKQLKKAESISKTFFKNFGKKTKDAGKKFGVFAKDLGSDLKESFSKGTEIAKEKLSGLKDAASERFADMKERASEAFSGAKSFAGDIFADLKEGNYGEAFDKIKTKIVEKFTEIKGRVSDIFSKLLDPIKERIKGPINFMIGSINSMIEKVNSALTFTLETPDWAKSLGITDFNFETKIPTIPALAEGGIVEKATLAMVGEAGPEAVVPLDDFTQSNEKTQQEIRELKEIMGTFVQQMAQVVNQPMVIELDGNKVGEAMGRNSFRVQ